MISELISNPLFPAYTFIACIVLLILWIIRLEIKTKRLLMGKSAKSLEDSIVEAGRNLEKLNKFQNDSLSYYRNIEERLARSVQAVETIRFNPFKGVGEGGNQSFSTSFINEKGNGAVISSLYSRDRISIFSKPIEKFTSTYDLTEEEKETIEKSKQNLKK